MPTVLPNTGITLPTRGAAGAGQWGDTDDANWAIVDAMDHTPGHGPRIPVAGLNINADLPFSSLWAPTQLHRVQFSNIAGGALTAGQRTSLFTSDGTSGLVANELYWHNSSGNKVQITSGNTLNFAAFVGGIGQDYTSVGATLNYNDGQKAYEFKEGTVDSHGWARLRTGDVRLFPFNTTGAVFVGMAAPGGIAGSYTVTWPLTLPSAAQVLTIDNTGQVADDGVLGTNKNITLSGTGVIKHGTRTLQLHATAFTRLDGGYTGPATLFGSIRVLNQADGMAAPITLSQGARILAIRVFVLDSSTGPTKAQASLRTTTSTGTLATVASSAQSSGAGAAQTLTIGSLTTVISANTGYYIQVIQATGTDLTTVYGAEVDYDWP
jgi:hypothetical protein